MQSFCHLLQSSSSQPVGRPFIHRHCAEGPVKVNAGLIPVKACPFQPSTATLYSNLRQLFQQRFPISFPTVFRKNKQILQVNACSSKKCREVMEEQGKSYFFIAFTCEQYFRFLSLKDSFPQQILRCHHLIRHLFISCQLSDIR